MKGITTKRMLSLLLVQAFVLFLLHVPALAEGVKVSVTPSNLSPIKGEVISLSINVDISGTSELLGAISATLLWNSEVLRYINHTPAKAEALVKVMVNSEKASSGRLVFAGFNPIGIGGAVKVLNVSFEVVGEAGASPGVQLEIKELIAARTFVDLRSFLKSTLTGVETGFGIIEIPKEYELVQNYPNPFNANTEIGFALPKEAHVRLSIYNLLGEKITTLVDEDRKAGRYKVRWDGTDSKKNPVSSGVYIYRMEAGNFKAQKRMSIVK